MIVHSRPLPRRPWPLTIGGIPLWLTESATDTPVPEGRGGRSASLLPDLGLSNISFSVGEDFASIATYFSEEFSVLISDHVEWPISST